MRFVEQASPLGFVHTGQGRGLVPLDYDRDGDRDFLISANRESVTLLRNDLVHAATTAWIVVQLDTSANPNLAPNSWGARVEVNAGGKLQAALMNGGCHYMSSDAWELHFGLGSATAVDSIEVSWPDASLTVLGDLPINQIHVISAP